MDLNSFLQDPLAGDLSDAALDALGADASPDELATEQVEQPAAESDVAASAPSSAGAPAQEAESTAQQEAAPEPERTEPEVILTRDGKHALPFEVLRREREARQKLEAEKAELQARLDKQSPAEQPAAPAAQAQAALTPEQLAEIRQRDPATFALLEAMAVQIEQLKASAQVTQQDLAQRQRSAVEQAIDAVPKLAYLQAQADKAAFNEVAEIDQFLRAKPEYRDVPMKDRFERAVAMYEAARGPIDVPGRASPSAKTADVQAKASAAIAKAQAAAAVPNTLSDIPGGQVPATNSALDDVSAMTAATFTEKLARMSPSEIDQYLARLPG